MTSLITSVNKTLVLTVIVYVCFLLTAAIAYAQTPDFEIPKPTGHVNDYAGVIDAGTKQALEQTLINLKEKQKIEFSVVTVKTTGGRDIFEYTLAVGRQWGIGSADEQKQGLLLLVAIDDRKYHTLVSRHLQGELTDGTTGTIQRQNLIPAFRAGKYGEGLTNTIRAYIDTLASKRGFSTAGIYQPGVIDIRTSPSRRRDSGSGFSVCGVIVLILVVIVFMIATRGRGGGSGCLNALLLGSLLSNLTRGGSGSGGWTSGGFGDSSGDSGGGFGGFGGGGDFDGGGSGGSW